MNKILIAVIFAGFGAQVIKLIIYWFRHKSLTWRDLIVTGGMPSSHAAFVVALVTSIYLEESVSTAFAISLVLAFIVLRDAFGVRRTVGEEGLLLTQILKKLKIKSKTHFSIGHTPLQVLVGAVLGFLCAVGVFFWL
ncbi:MAG: divergent PAP2 family protein [Nanoarchaeota archaeon]